MKIFVQNVGAVTLDQKNFIAKGGEGSIYGKGNIAYKIFEDRKHSMPEQKIKELSVLDRYNIIKPEHLIFDTKNHVLGYTMKLVKDTYAICQLFNKSFKQRNNITHEMSINLVKQLQETVKFIHNKNILVVDLNELNFLCNNTFDDIYAIDVNSYQTNSFPATAIMDSIRDRHSHNKFNENTDWFSFGIVSFQMLIGIHPYKGKHPDYENLPFAERLDQRMLNNASVFDKNVLLPKVCEPFSAIPKALKHWYEQVFDKGKRLPPPDNYEISVHVVVHKTKVVSGNLIEITPLQECDWPILDLYPGFNNVALTKNHIYVGAREFPKPSSKTKVCFIDNKPIAAWINNGLLNLREIETQTDLSINSAAEELMDYDGRVYVKNGIDIIEIRFLNTNNRLIPLQKIVGKVMDLDATKIFDGVIIQNMLGKHYASIFPNSGVCYQIKLTELDNLDVIDAKYENHVLVAIAVDRKGNYHRHVFWLNDNYSTYTARVVNNINYTGINFTVTDSGTAVLIREDDKIEVFRGTHINIVEDKAINGNMKLYHLGNSILFTQDNKIYSMKMK